MKISIATLSFSICVLAAISGVIFYSNKEPDSNLEENTNKVNLHIQEADTGSRTRISHPSAVKIDQFAVALSYLKRINGSVKAKKWRQALISKQDLSRILASDRITRHQRNYIKLKLLDIAIPVYRTGDPNVAMRICTRSCGQPSNSPEPLKLSSKMLDIAEILFDRLSSNNPAAGHNFRYYLNTSKVFMRESKNKSIEKSKIKKRIENLENRIKARSSNFKKLRILNFIDST